MDRECADICGLTAKAMHMESLQVKFVKYVPKFVMRAGTNVNNTLINTFRNVRMRAVKWLHNSTIQCANYKIDAFSFSFARITLLNKK
jgi:hypothetical protein